MKSQEIRERFIHFFAERGHRRTASAPIITHGDPTLLFVNAGMVPFKDAFLGLETPASPRAVSAQKCLRVSGKHNDLENVGPSPRHHTFFEMLGNFSFGDYFKEDAIRFAWEMVTDGWGLDPSVLYATVFEDDDEAEALWRDISTLPHDRILRCGAKDNFWQMGETGPCGPCSEIFVDRYPDRPPEDWETGSENGRYLEIWNLVFMQFDRDAEGTLTPLPNPSIDTGAGLERVAAVLQGVASNYDTDLFQPILRATADLASCRYGDDPAVDTSLRVIADHLRAVSFLLVDCVIPGADGRGYVLRRLLRRAVRHGLRIGFEEPFLYRLVPTLVEVLGDHYTELAVSAQGAAVTIREEEEKYLTTRASGARRIQAAIDAARASGATQLDGKTLFDLHETHGQGIDTVREIAEEEQLGVDVAGFEAEVERQRDRSREATEAHQKQQKSLRDALCGGGQAEALGATPFEGYSAMTLDGATIVRAARRAGDFATASDTLEAGAEGVMALDRTVLYAEGGGQVGDHGSIVGPEGHARVVDTQKDAAGVVFHYVRVEEGQLTVGQSVALSVDIDRRRAIERNHTATHLLHAALRQVLGDGVRQAGSLVTPERLRFDFTYKQPIEADELARVEDVVNHWAREAVPVAIATQDREAAQARGAMALFGEKYGDEVRTVEIRGFSFELCGGCHVRNSGEIGLALVVGERGIASGVRRVEMVTGTGAATLVRERKRLLDDVEHALGVPAERAGAKVGDLQTKVKALEKELAQVRMQMVSGTASGGAEAQEIAGIKVIAREIPTAPVPELRAMADKLRDQQGSGVVVLASAQPGDKVTLIATVSKDLTKTIKAGDLVKQLAPIVDGRGGGRPDFAQAGGKAPDKLGEMLAAVPEAVASLVAG